MSSHKHLNIFEHYIHIYTHTYIHTMDELLVVTKKISKAFTFISSRYAGRTMLRCAHKPHSKRKTKHSTDSEI